MTPWSSTRTPAESGESLSTPGRSNHWWGSGTAGPDDTFLSTCRHCGLVERSEWWLDRQGRPATGLTWVSPTGRVVTVTQFKFNKNRRPSVEPTRSWSEVYPHVPTGSPQCPKSRDGWGSTPQPEE